MIDLEPILAAVVADGTEGPNAVLIRLIGELKEAREVIESMTRHRASAEDIERIYNRWHGDAEKV